LVWPFGVSKAVCALKFAYVGTDLGYDRLRRNDVDPVDRGQIYSTNPFQLRRQVYGRLVVPGFSWFPRLLCLFGGSCRRAVWLGPLQDFGWQAG